VWSTAILIVFTLAVPYLPFMHYLGFIPLPGSLMATLAGITVLYVFAAELAKGPLYHWAGAPGRSSHPLRSGA
jgi:Mg2+-importing ATPase